VIRPDRATDSVIVLLVRLLAQFVVGLATSAIALLVAAIVLDRFTISELTFPIVVVIFTVVGLITRPVIEALIDDHAQVLASLVGLAAAFVTLLITDLVSDSLDVEGIGTWVLASLIVWIGRIVADLLLAERILGRLLGTDRAAR
jgi:putative membrane protein